MPLTTEPKSDSTTIPTDAEMQQQVKMLKEFMRDLEIAIRVSFESGIATTDATYVTKNTVVITELKFNNVIAKFEKDPSIFRLMLGIPTPEPWSLETSFNNLNSSVKMETKSTIQV